MKTIVKTKVLQVACANGKSLNEPSKIIPKSILKVGGPQVTMYNKPKRSVAVIPESPVESKIVEIEDGGKMPVSRKEFKS